MRRARTCAWVVVATCGCGRLGFQPQAGATDAATDATTDATTGDATVDGLTPAFLLYTFEEGSGAFVRDRAATGVDLAIDNVAEVQWESAGLHVFGAALQAGAPTAFYAAVLQSNAVSVEVWFTPDTAGAATPSPRRIVALSPDSSDPNLILGHGEDLGGGGDVWTSRVMAGGSLSNIQTAPGTARAQLVHLVLVHRPNGDQVIYVDGVRVALKATMRTLTTWDPTFPLTVANHPTGGRALAGVLRRVALYAHALTDAEIAARFSAGPPGPP